MSQNQLVAWLDDAYAMETGLIPILQTHAGAFESKLPEAAARVREHISETRRHADRLEQCLRTLGSTPSTAKSTVSAVMGTVEGMSTSMFRDELVKNALADYGAEQFEVACYTALVTAAMKLGYPDVAHLCEQNLKEDEAMAAWLRQQLPAAVNAMLTRNP
jgi:ferritin-like metal-binding protein YciE